MSYRQSYWPQEGPSSSRPLMSQQYRGRMSPDRYTSPYADHPARPSSRLLSQSFDSDHSKQTLSDYDQAYAAYGAPLPPRTGNTGAGSRKKWWIIGGLVAALAIGGGVTAAVLLVDHHKSSSSAGTVSNMANGSISPSSTVGSTTSSSPTPTQSSTASASSSTAASNANDPSVFTLNPALHKSFYAMAYETPGGSNYPNCNDSLAEIIPQIQLLSQLTPRLRTYGSDCNQTWLIQEAIKQTKTSMSVILGVYMDAAASVFERQMAQTIAVLKEFGSANVIGVQVGNEYILDTVTGGGSQATAQALVLSNVALAKKQLAAAGFGSIPVGSGDAGEFCTKSYAAGLDFVMCNNHPFFAGVTIDQAPDWPYSYMTTSDPSAAYTAANKPTIWQGEVGWPSNAISGGSLTLNGSIASLENMQYMLDNFVCQSNANVTATATNPVAGTSANPIGIPYVWFSSFGLWVNYELGGVEPFWGLFDENNNLKNLTMPTCLTT